MKSQALEGIIKFLTEIGKLKDTRRTGWVLREVKNPESIADHTFRTALMVWVLAKKRGFDIEKLIKMALVHDLCEVYAGVRTPYDDLVAEHPEQKKEILSKWRHQLQDERKRRDSEKTSEERESLDRVVESLPSELRDEFRELWFEFEEGFSKEGRFLRQVDRVENLLQALEYKRRGEEFAMGPWWEQIKEVVDDKELLEFVSALDEYFNGEEPKVASLCQDQ